MQVATRGATEAWVGSPVKPGEWGLIHVNHGSVNKLKNVNKDKWLVNSG